MKSSIRLLLARIAIAPVFLWNVQCAAAFLLWPDLYTGGFELTGAPGAAAVQGMGILFLMWNIPYAVALWHPLRRRVSLYEAAAMQAVGLVGESLLWMGLAPEHAILRGSILRFILFDGAGLVLLLVAGVIIWKPLRAARETASIE